MHPDAYSSALLSETIAPPTQGLALLSTAASCLAEKELTEYKRAIYFSSSSLYGHYPPVFGLVSRTLGMCFVFLGKWREDLRSSQTASPYL